jgi:tetratricopeptide (TPR) repeat protein
VRRFYPHEDIYVVIYLTNQGERPVPVSTPEFNWHQHLQVNLERREEQEDKPQLEEDTNTLQHLRVNLGQRENERWVSTPTRVRFIREFRQVHPRYREKLPESRPVAAGMLPPGEQIVAGVALTDENGKRPNPGIYRVTATFGSLGRFTRTIEFEVRETLTTEDRLNSLYHQGVRARWDKKYGEAERALKELIILHPTSARAHAELGAIKLDQGDYKAAVEWFRKAATLVQTAADPYIPQSQRFREDWEAALQQSIEKCQRLANPKQ